MLHPARLIRISAIAACATIAATAIAGSAANPALAGAAGEDPSNVLHASVTNAALEVYDLDPQTGACTHQDPTTGRCAIPFYATDNFAGDLVGQQQESGGLSVTPTFIGHEVGLATYSGTVKGCPGPGTALFQYVYTVGVNGQPGNNHGTINVVPGSGTGGLSMLKGNGVVDVTTTTNGTITNAQLNFSCTVQHHD
jgi:hypothetical protein